MAPNSRESNSCPSFKTYPATKSPARRPPKAAAKHTRNGAYSRLPWRAGDEVASGEHMLPLTCGSDYTTKRLHYYKMKPFLDQNFLLQTPTAERLYHEYAAGLPIIDYHNHLSPKEIATNHKFADITEVWLNGDHYKWRAMRANGINEGFITGGASPREKFRKWAETVPKTLRNPLYHWTHLELQRYFGINELLSGQNADAVYDQTTEQLQRSSHSSNGLLSQMKVEVVCTWNSWKSWKR